MFANRGEIGDLRTIGGQIVGIAPLNAAVSSCASARGMRQHNAPANAPEGDTRGQHLAVHRRQLLGRRVDHGEEALLRHDGQARIERLAINR